ncbi:MAG: type II secretion system F family protein [Bacilli bacterium]|nr:type II secretion system F family protein [Bacilli bacterium]
MKKKLIYLLYPSIYIYYIVSFILKIPFYIIKYFFIGLYYMFKYVFKYLIAISKFIFKIIKYFFDGLFYIFKYIIKILKNIALFIGKIFKKIGKFIKKIGSALKKGLNILFNAIKKGFELLAKRLENTPNRIKNNIENFKKAIIRWYNSLAPVKYLKNKRDMERQELLIDFMEHNIERSDKKITYKFVAKDKDNKIIKGYFDAFSKADVHSYLLTEQLEVYSIKTSGYIDFISRINYPKSYKIKLKDLTFILTQLSTYIKSGIPLVDAIKILTRQTKSGPKKKIFDSVVYELVMGTSFSEALEKQGPAFPRLLVNMIKTAEMTGKLSDVLDDMAEYYDSVQKTRSQMLSAMLYPLMVLFMSTGVVIFVMIYVIPKFIDMFRNMETEIPLITRIVINTSDFLKSNFILLLIGIIVFIIIVRLLYSTVKAFRYIIQWIIMHIPVMGKIIIYNEVTMFAKTFGSLLTHNVFLTDSMEILTKITNNEIYKFLIFDTMTNLARGDKISDSFKDHWAFPTIAYEMLLTGERTGELGVMMNKVGEYYQEQHKLSINQIKSFIEPVMIMFLAGTVGTILLSIIIPMFQMYSEFQ